MTRKIALFDLDGTLANLESRQNWLMSKPKNWNAFGANVMNDKPIWPVIDMAKMLYAAGHCVIAVSGRNQGKNGEILTQTAIWLDQLGVKCHDMFMRAHDDFRDDTLVKKDFLDQIRKDYGEPYMVFDDRKKVVDMWINNGIFVFDVAQGKGDF